MRNQNLLLISHLMRRAGFGATTPELKEYKFVKDGSSIPIPY